MVLSVNAAASIGAFALRTRRELGPTSMNQYLLASIESAQRTVERFARAGFEPARTIERQLTWCWSRAAGFIQEPPPAPLCMSYLMEHEFAKYGAYPLLAHQLRSIEAQIESLNQDAEKYAALAA